MYVYSHIIYIYIYIYIHTITIYIYTYLHIIYIYTCICNNQKDDKDVNERIDIKDHDENRNDMFSTSFYCMNIQHNPALFLM